MNPMLLERYGKVEDSPLVLRDLPAPQPGEGEAGVKVKACAILPRRGEYRNRTEPSGTVRNQAEPNGTKRNRSEPLGTVGNDWERS